MANLKRATFKNQIISAKCLLEARSISRHNNEDSNLTHSHELAKKRKMYLKDFCDFLTEKQRTGKMNIYMGNQEEMKKFLFSRLINLSKSTSVDYISGFSSLMLGLQKKNITIDDGGFKTIEEMRDMAKSLPALDFRKGRAFSNPVHIINRLYEIQYESGLIAQVQYETGLRISEAYRFLNNLQKYLIGNSIIGLVGKSKHLYDPKKISRDLILKLKEFGSLPNRHEYSKHIKKAANNPEAIPHDWRLTYVKIRFYDLINEGILRVDALRIVSKEINHHRISMTEYYLLRA